MGERVSPKYWWETEAERENSAGSLTGAWLPGRWSDRCRRPPSIQSFRGKVPACREASESCPWPHSSTPSVPSRSGVLHPPSFPLSLPASFFFFFFLFHIFKELSGYSEPSPASVRAADLMVLSGWGLSLCCRVGPALWVFIMFHLSPQTEGSPSRAAPPPSD